MKTDLSGKVALVNGASRGIGEAIAHGLAACGAKVVCTSRKIEGVQAVADAISEAGGEALAYTCNAGDLEQIEALMSFVREECGRLDRSIQPIPVNIRLFDAQFAREFEFVFVFIRHPTLETRGYVTSGCNINACYIFEKAFSLKFGYVFNHVE